MRLFSPFNSLEEAILASLLARLSDRISSRELTRMESAALDSVIFIREFLLEGPNGN